MHSGVITPDNLADVLRQISQRRRQGILELSLHSGLAKIAFVQGRIVDASHSAVHPAHELVGWLQRAGYPVGAAEGYPESISAVEERLKEECVTPFAIGPELIKNLNRHRIIEHLLSLDLGSGALYTFRVQLVETDKYSANISVGQLLLDLVEMEGEAATFAQIFQPETIVKAARAAKISELNEDEQMILRAIHDGCSVQELENRALLSRHAFRHGLLELRANGVLSVAVSQDDDLAIAEEGDLASFLSDSIDDAFGLNDPQSASNQPEGIDAGSAHQAEPTLCPRAAEAAELAELSTFAPAQLTLRARLAPMSAELLQSSMVPQCVALLFVILAFALPMASWSDLLGLLAEW
jgi:hypothetical protein